jgi:hypothetical protein
MPAGECATVEQVWELSKQWYRDRLSPGFTGRTHAEAHQIFEQVGLHGPFWRFDEAR